MHLYLFIIECIKAQGDYFQITIFVLSLFINISFVGR